VGIAIDLLRNYPKASRNLDARVAEKTAEVKAVARKFGKEFFDGDRKYGYGGFSYDSKYWTPVIPDFETHFGPLTEKSLLDVGCAKGFMLYDLLKLVPGIELAGIDISKYAIDNCLPEVKELLSVADARALPFKNQSFDVVISINTIHNLDLEDCKQALREISRVSKGNSFITVDAFSNEEERARMMAWNLTAKTILSVEEWMKLFDEVGYEGDYFWFIP
jgi:ubiquinone/menaquinone biosynthesis C-methylase UbiE